MSHRCPKCDVEYGAELRFCPVDGSALVTASADAESTGPFAAGQVMSGRYRVLSVLGQGAFGRTYIVEDTRTGRQAVLKLSQAQQPAAVDRFTKEAQLVGRITHPGFAPVFDFGQLDDGSPYYVQEWVRGETLDRQLDVSGIAPVNAVVMLGRRLADGLAHIHAMDIIHRDIKPSNIAIPGAPESPQWGEAKLLDFGVFGELNQREHGLRLTQTGQFFGTPRYMAPEQITSQPQSAATDVYALGLVMYEVLYGDLPFRTETGGAFEMMRRVLEQDVEFPSQPPIPAVLIDVLDRCLARDPRDRFADGKALREALDRVGLVPEAQPMRVAHRHTGAAPAASAPPLKRSRPSRPSVASELPRRSRVAMLVVPIAVVVALALVLTWILILPARGASGGPGIALSDIYIELIGIAGGGLLIVAGLWGGTWLGQKLRRLQSSLAMDAERFLLGVETKKSLSETLAIELRELLERCKALDERVLGMTIARMIDEYDVAESSGDRQSALMNVSTLTERLKTRLSPWYVKQERALTLLAKGVGVIGGLIAAALNVVKLMNGS